MIKSGAILYMHPNQPTMNDNWFFPNSQSISEVIIMSKNYMFLFAWIAGSDSACEDDTKINNSEDLHSEFEKGNQYVESIIITAPNEHIACVYGYAEMFHNNYTAIDSTSTVYEVDVIDELLSRKIRHINCNQ
jgi:hypothetical protein